MQKKSNNPPDLDPEAFGWMIDEGTKSHQPVPLPYNIDLVPDFILFWLYLFCVRHIGRVSVVLRFWVGERHIAGWEPPASDLLAGPPILTPIESVVMIALKPWASRREVLNSFV